MNTQTENTKSNIASDVEEVTGAFARVGAAWARYGLGVARLSVATSARTLDATAKALGVLADRFEKLAQDDDDDVIDTSGHEKS
jgi:hypothetical protein